MELVEKSLKQRNREFVQVKRAEMMEPEWRREKEGQCRAYSEIKAWRK